MDFENFNIGVCKEDFEFCMGRKPKDEEEFTKFVYLCMKGVESQIDWDIIYKCVKEELE